ncbi:Serine/threonine-protein phosphatase 7 [Cinnamomum micranthum f. kanehirae]|uniref:Serine/threonine-protein phosphatase 7 n=1 Tax=Cinnamomum micranthum f. kanehirae TaxID=337451 RepID=A0A3S3N7F1_9MAGN|nr:Serine/threonine-protein phosphatase 7 [Cinnamomum micranthum f. kanehirae]
MADLSIVEERSTFMMFSITGEPYIKIARFLKPTAKTPKEAIAVPSHHLIKEPMNEKPSKSPSMTEYKGWRRPQHKWELWISLMLPRHDSTCQRFAVLDYIKASTCEIQRDPATILGLVESWCADTNAFVFEWGESTITLEDVLILGGFSVLGEFVNAPLSEEMGQIEKTIVKAHRGFNKMKSKKDSHGAWLNHFIGINGELEHVAFLSLWLSRYVFPTHPVDTIGRNVFSIVVQLAKGTRIALGPAVLANLYRGFSLMKRNMDNDAPNSVVWAPFQLLYKWAQKRFSPLRQESKPNTLSIVRRTLKSKKGFHWMPYKKMSVEDEELHLLVIYVRASKLVGLNCSKPYCPYRVAMQFRFDQDLPSYVSDNDCERTNEEININMPYQVFQPEVSMRYLQWWKRTVSDKRATIEEIMKQLMSSKEGDVRDESIAIGLVAPGFRSTDKKRNLEEAWDRDDLNLKLKEHEVGPSKPFPIKNKEDERASSMPQHERTRVKGAQPNCAIMVESLAYTS